MTDAEMRKMERALWKQAEDQGLIIKSVRVGRSLSRGLYYGFFECAYPTGATDPFRIFRGAKFELQGFKTQDDSGHWGLQLKIEEAA